MASIEFLEFQQKFASQIVEQIFDKPLFNARAVKDATLWKLASLNRPPFPAQVEQGILPIVSSLREYSVGILVAEMGTGKTQMSYSVAELVAKGGKVLFLTSGGKHVPKMGREAEEIFGNSADIYYVTNKYSHEKISEKKGEVRPEDIDKIKVEKGRIAVFVLSKDTAKVTLKEDTGFKWGAKCPNCNELLLPKSWRSKYEKGKVTVKDFKKIKGNPKECPTCNSSLLVKVASPLWEGNGVFKSKKPLKHKGPRKISVGQRLKRQVGAKRIFDLLIVDEVHEMQNSESLQGKAYRELIQLSKKTMIMTGTLSNGMASSIFYILQAILPKYFNDLGYPYHKISRFVDHFGARKHTKVVSKAGEGKGLSGGLGTTSKELPKISDKIISLMAPFTAWVSMKDLNLEMPEYEEYPHIIPLDEEYKKHLDEFKVKALKLISAHAPELRRAFASRFVYWQNNLTKAYKYEFKGVEVQGFDENENPIWVDREFVIEYEPLPESILTSKERALIEKVEDALNRDRGCLVYSIYNKAAEVSSRLGFVLERAFADRNITIKVMPEYISGIKIEEWIDKNPCDILIASPLKLATGLDLVQFPSIFFYETGTKLRVVDQAKRRSWRAVGQDKKVEVHFFAYAGVQANILDILGKKMRAAATVEGRRVEGAQLANEFDDDADFTAALNKIADELEEELELDFSDSRIEAGKPRPWTKLEARFMDILESIQNEAETADDFIDAELEESVEPLKEASLTISPEKEGIEVLEFGKEELGNGYTQLTLF